MEEQQKEMEEGMMKEMEEGMMKEEQQEMEEEKDGATGLNRRTLKTWR